MLKEIGKSVNKLTLSEEKEKQDFKDQIEASKIKLKEAKLNHDKAILKSDYIKLKHAIVSLEVLKYAVEYDALEANRRAMVRTRGGNHEVASGYFNDSSKGIGLIERMANELLNFINVGVNKLMGMESLDIPNKAELLKTNLGITIENLKNVTKEAEKDLEPELVKEITDKCAGMLAKSLANVDKAKEIQEKIDSNIEPDTSDSEPEIAKGKDAPQEILE